MLLLLFSFFPTLSLLLTPLLPLPSSFLFFILFFSLCLAFEELLFILLMLLLILFRLEFGFGFGLRSIVIIIY